jgi:hypothetical protein
MRFPRFEVAVHHTLRVRGAEAPGELQAELEREAARDRAAVDAAAQGLAVDELADDEGHAPVAAGVVDGDHVGVGDGGRRAPLGLEAAHTARPSRRSATTAP